MHRSYDGALRGMENGFLQPMLKSLLAEMHGILGSGAGSDLSTDVRADVDLYLAVARQLLGDTSAAPVAGASAAAVAQLVALAQAASGVQIVSIFGEQRYVDFSQFKPRGHYADQGPVLEGYFRAMIWLGRTDFRFLQYDTSATPDTPPRFFRRQFLAALLLAELTDGNGRLDRWHQIDNVLLGFVGESQTSRAWPPRRACRTSPRWRRCPTPRSPRRCSTAVSGCSGSPARSC